MEVRVSVVILLTSGDSFPFSQVLGVGYQGQMPLASLLSDLRRKWPRSKRELSDIDSGAAQILVQHWKVLLEEARRLHMHARCFSDNSRVLSRVERELRECLGLARHSVELQGFADFQQEPAQSFASVGNLHIACGSPTYTGCLAVDGSRVRWGVFTNGTHGILRAMDKLGLQILLMPGARLSSGTVIPGTHDFYLIARGGPEYASTAAVVSRSALALTARPLHIRLVPLLTVLPVDFRPAALPAFRALPFSRFDRIAVDPALQNAGYMVGVLSRIGNSHFVADSFVPVAVVSPEVG